MSGRRACFRRRGVDMSGAAFSATAGTAPGRSTLALVVPVLIFLALAALPVAAFVLAEGYVLNLATRVMIFAIAAVALDLVVGYGGLVSFGHAAFVGLGAYAV